MPEERFDSGNVDLILRSNSPCPPDIFSLTGRTRVVPSAIANDAILIVFMGESLNANSVSGGTFSPVHGSGCFNLSIAHRGALFNSKAPLLVADDDSFDHHGRWLADMLISDGRCSQVVIALIAIAASFGSDWAPDGGNCGLGSRPGSLAYRMGLAARCINNSELGRLRRIIDWNLGTSDSLYGTSQSDHIVALNAMIIESKKSGLLRNNTDVMFIHKETNLSAVNANRLAIRSAQDSVVDGNLVRLGADTDSLPNTYRWDGVHFNYALGAQAQAGLKRIAYETWI